MQMNEPINVRRRIGVFFAFVWLGLSCRSDETNQRKLEDKLPLLTQGELEGKTFEGRLHVKSPTHQKSSSLAKAFEQAKLQYQFKANGQVIYHITVGGMSNKLAFTWRLKGDSLLFERTANRQLKTSRYFIQRTRDGFTLENDEYRAQLRLK